MRLRVWPDLSKKDKGVSPVKRQIHFVFLTAVCDILAVAASLLGAYHFRFLLGVIPIRGGAPEFEQYARALVVVVPVFLFFFRAYGLYRTRRYIRRVEEIFVVFKAASFSVLVLMALSFLYRGFSYSRIYLVLLWGFSVILVSANRYLLIQWEYRRKLRKKDQTRVLVIGANRNARQIIQWAKANPHYGHEIIGVLSRRGDLVGKHLEGVPVIGVYAQCENFITHLRPTRVVLLESEFPREKLTELVVLCEDQFIDFNIGADFYGLLTRNVDVEYISGVPLLGFKTLPLDDFWNRLVKRIFDVVVASALLIVFFPVMAAAAIAVWLTDRGPAIYTQERLGRDGKIFMLYKLRTMGVDAEKKTGPVWTSPGDSRRTPVGNYLRRWNVDEMPQLVNVLKGHMSMVGPRPERPHFVRQFREDIPRYMSRHKIKSGLTGWAQVNGYRGNTSIVERTKYDLFYMENWSLLFDIEILFMTFFAFKAFKNAY